MAFNDWLKSDKTVGDTFLAELYDEALSVEVYRSVNSDNSVGFDTEMADETNIKSINARIEDSKPPAIYGYTDDTDILVNDHWKYANVNGKVRWYTVKTVINYDYGTEVLLDAGRK